MSCLIQNIYHFFNGLYFDNIILTLFYANLERVTKTSYPECGVH